MTIQELYRFYQQHPEITTDSRNCPEGSIFIALKGESFDGNRFALKALEQGCSLAVVSDKEVYDSFTERKQGAWRDRDVHMVLVDDTLQTFKDLAREHRRRFNIPIVGITGTNGKTTTKELVSVVLGAKYRVMATEGNFNNDVGVPKTLFRLNNEHEIAVVEMGASHPGDIKTLVETAEPTCGLITNVGKAHLLGFGSFEGVIRTKGELYDFLATRTDATIFVNADNEHLMGIVPRNVNLECYAQQATDAKVIGEIVACDPFLRLRWRENKAGAAWHQIDTQLIGSYNLDNVLAAVTVGLHFEVPADAICRAIAEYVPKNNRSQLTKTAHNQLIVDAYNANPTSMAAALANFHLMQVSPKMAIIGQMGELGSGSAEEHIRLVEMLKQYGFDRVWLVGKEFADIPCDFRKFADVGEVKAALNAQQVDGFTILIKGSNSVRLFELPELL